MSTDRLGQVPPLPTAVYAVLGNPVAQSMSPLMHTTVFRHLGVDAAYVPFEVEDLPGAVAGLRALKCKGASITHPFKEAIIPHIDDVDPTAERIGAVNTLVMSDGGISGKNTDWLGVVRTIEGLLPVGGNVFAVLGAGGAARAALFGIADRGGRAIVINRSEGRGRTLADEFEASFALPSHLNEVRADCLINTTPVGMHPHTEKMPVPGEALGRFRAVIDIIYNPLETKLLREARSQGCMTASGLEMFVQQGAEQLRLWMGIEPPTDLMRDCVYQRLAADTRSPGQKKNEDD